MSSTLVWVAIALTGAGTFLLRFAGIGLLGKRPLPQWLARPLRYVPAAVFAALVVPTVVLGGPDPGLVAGNMRLPAAIAAAVTAWRTRSVLLTLVVGMGTLWLLEWWSAR